MAKCTNCYCDCHCDSAMHLPEDNLDKGGACACENCKCGKKRTYKTRKEWANDMS